MAIRINKPELLISAIALILSIIATISAIYFSLLSIRTTVLPSLVFVYDSEKGWSLRNVGNGPALNIVVAHTQEGSKEWLLPMRLYPLPEGDGVWLCWVGHGPDKLGVVYSDAHDRQYASICDEDLTTFPPRRELPSWKPDEIKRIWEHPCIRATTSNCILEFPQPRIKARFLSHIDNFGSPLDDRYHLEFEELTYAFLLTPNHFSPIMEELRIE